MHGVKAIPDEWLQPLELRGVITEIAEDLYAFRDWKIGEYINNKVGERIWRKYPGVTVGALNSDAWPGQLFIADGDLVTKILSVETGGPPS